MCSTEVDNLSDKKAYTYILMEKHLQNKFQQNTYVTLTQRIMWLDNWTNQWTNHIAHFSVKSFWNAWAKVFNQND